VGCCRRPPFVLCGTNMAEHLGEFEQIVLLAIVRLGEGAYGVPIRNEIEKRTGRRVSIGANEAMARQRWPGQEAIGKIVWLGCGESTPRVPARRADRQNLGNDGSGLESGSVPWRGRGRRRISTINRSRRVSRGIDKRWETRQELRQLHNAIGGPWWASLADQRPSPATSFSPMHS
jgi:hypothetical protein